MDDAEHLRQQLRDEAAWRAFVEQEFAREADKARIWRQRAEDRAERIERLLAGRSLRQALASRISRSRPPRIHLPADDTARTVAASATRPSPRTVPPAYPAVRAATIVASPAAAALAAELDAVAMTATGPAPRDADVLLVEAAAVPRLGDDELGAATALLSVDVRAPAVWLGQPPAALEALVLARDVVVDGQHPAAPTITLRPWAAAVPPWSLPRPGSSGRWVDDRVTSVLSTQHGPAAATTASPHRALGLALAGIPVLGDDGTAVHGLPGPRSRLDLDELGAGAPVPEELRRLGIRQRRHVAATSTAVARVGELLARLDVPHTRPRTRLAALLSSNRPGLVADQIAALGAQRRPPEQLCCALHGGADTETVRDVEQAAEEAGLALRLLTPDADVPLGRVMNLLAAEADAELLAKIDDDDYYGPSCLLDAVDAIAWTGADLVGKKAHYVHLRSRDRTLLLAAGSEDEATHQGIMGATFVWRRALQDRLPFAPRPRRVDSLYVRAAAAAGARIWALPANDFAYIRSGAGGVNVAGGSFVEARGIDVGPGLPREVVDV